MRTLEGLEACRNCLSRDYVSGKGMICKLTGKNPEIEGECPDFKLDEELTKVAPIPEERVLEEIDMDALRKEENLLGGVLGGIVAALVGAVAWALVSVSTGYQIGFMAIGMGFLVGYAVRFMGKGVSPVFGVVGALLALLGCVLGDYLSIIGFIAEDYESAYFDVLTGIPVVEMAKLLIENVLSMTALFYGFALFEGYKLSFRLQISNEGKI